MAAGLYLYWAFILAPTAKEAVALSCFGTGCQKAPQTERLAMSRYDRGHIETWPHPDEIAPILAVYIILLFYKMWRIDHHSSSISDKFSLTLSRNCGRNSTSQILRKLLDLYKLRDFSDTSRSRGVRLKITCTGKTVAEFQKSWNFNIMGGIVICWSRRLFLFHAAAFLCDNDQSEISVTILGKLPENVRS